MPAGYTKLWTYRFAVIIHDFTVIFCRRWLLSDLSNLSHLHGKDRRTADQMIQAARSGKQNIVEGAEAMLTSIKSTIVLTNVARASTEELIQDYEDFLRQRNLIVWNKLDSRVWKIRKYYGQLVSNLSDINDLTGLKLTKNPENAANLLLTICHQNSYLLYKQIKALELKHLREGGYSEKLYRDRIKYRSKNTSK